MITKFIGALSLSVYFNTCFSGDFKDNSNNLLEDARAGNLTEVDSILKNNSMKIRCRNFRKTLQIEDSMKIRYRNFRKALQIEDSMKIRYRNFRKALRIADSMKNQLDDLLEAVRTSNLDKVVSIIEKNPEYLNMKYQNSGTALHVAASTNNLKFVQYLVETAETKKIDVNVFCDYIGTPLDFAASKGYLEIVKFFFEKNPPEDLLLALHDACQNGHLEVLKYFIENVGMDINKPDPYRLSPLMTASSNNYLEIVQYLLQQSNIDVNFANDAGNQLTALLWACNMGHLEVVKALTEHPNINMNARSFDGQTALHHAALNGHLDVVRYLVKEKTFDINSQDDYKKTALEAARKHLESMQSESYFYKAEEFDTLKNVISYLESLDNQSISTTQTK